ncbi:MAG: EAL domain-containing protein [Pseudomonadota bacterium]
MRRQFGLVLPIALLTMIGTACFAVAGLVLVPHPDMDGEQILSTTAALTLGALGCVFTLAGAGFTIQARRIERSMTDDLRKLPKDLRFLLRQGVDRPLAGEFRDDPVGRLARRLRVLGHRVHHELSAQAEVERMAITDPLTDLLNRRGLMGRLEAVLNNLADDRAVALLHIDLDHFKVINDTLGHQAGDHVLQEATKRMSNVLRGTDMHARLGGDEFLIVAQGLSSVDGLERMADRLLRQFSQPIKYEDELCPIGASVGARLVFGRDGPFETEALMSEADTALCDAKASGRNRWVLFTDEMAETIQRRTDQARELREALLDGEFRAWYQPVIDLDSGAIEGIELLTRWEHPERGLLLPDKFLLSAESNNMLDEIGLQVLEVACLEMKTWQAKGLEVPPLHVNMTRDQMVASGVVDKVSWILDDCNIAPEKLILEVSEQSCEGRSVEVLFSNLRRFADLGIDTTLDDFGSLSSSVSNIVNTGARRIKFSRNLTLGLSSAETRDASEQMLHGLVSFAERLDIDVIAKGAEDLAQIEQLQAIGVRRMQGDGLAAAMSGPDLEKLLPSMPPLAAVAGKSA